MNLDRAKKILTKAGCTILPNNSICVCDPEGNHLWLTEDLSDYVEQGHLRKGARRVIGSEYICNEPQNMIDLLDMVSAFDDKFRKIIDAETSENGA
jgi:hypothetical protein